MIRSFVAVWPPPEVVERLRVALGPVGAGLRPVAPASWHVTLRFLGEVETESVMGALADASFPRATARLGPAVERFGDRVLAVPVRGLDELAAAVRRATDGIGEASDRRFRGHLTIARVPRGTPPPRPDLPVDATFVVDEVRLMTSELRPSGAVHTTVARYATSGPG